MAKTLMHRRDFHRMADIRRELAERSGHPSFLHLCAQLDRVDERERRPLRFLRDVAPHLAVNDSLIRDWFSICLLLDRLGEGAGARHWSTPDRLSAV